MALPKSQYRHLQALQNLDKKTDEKKDRSPSASLMVVEEDVQDSALLNKGSEIAPPEVEFLDDEEQDEKAKSSALRKKARIISRGNESFFLAGSFGAILAGLMFPGWGFVFAYMIELLYKPVFFYDEDKGEVCTPDGFCEDYGDCQEYRPAIADDMQETSFKVAYGLVGVLVTAVIGNGLVWYGFGTAS